MTATITLQIPEAMYHCLVDTAQATKRPLEEIMLRVLEVGSPPNWTDVPEAFQADLMALDRMEDDALWKIAYSHRSEAVTERFNTLLEGDQPGGLTLAEKEELMALQMECDRFMLCKAQAAAILRWRGHHTPPP